jgi:hypothetical protein
MRKKVTGSGLLIVVELGGEWPGLLRAAPLTERRVLTQAEGETPAEFTDRVTSSIDSLFGRGVRLSTVALASNERLDAAAEAARRMLCSVALGAMAEHKSGKLYLTASARSSGRLHHALSSLAQGLSEEWDSAGLEVSVEFGEESRSSVTASAAPAARVA